MQIYADVIVDIASDQVDRTFQYLIPEALVKKVKPGSIVLISFGRGRKPIKGYVTGISYAPKIAPDRIRPLEDVLMTGHTEQEKLISLAAWMKQRYGCTMIQALKTVLPFQKKFKEKEDVTISLSVSEKLAQEILEEYKRKHQSARARALEGLLSQPGHAARWTDFRAHFQTDTAVRNALEEQGLIRVDTNAHLRDPLETFIRIEEEYAGRGGTGTEKEKQAEKAGKAENPPAMPGEAHLPVPSEARPAAAPSPEGCPVLNQEQAHAVEAIESGWTAQRTAYGSFLIHGVTGSGKTEVYLELIEAVLRRGQQAIVLIPEIALTLQTVTRFYRRFGKRVSLINSRLSEAERYDQFLRAQKGEIDIMIGPRSALFTPFENLGIIIMDEEQEPAYISQTMPRYNTRETAIRRAQLENACFAAGSATPSLDAYYDALHGQAVLLKMTHRATGAALAQVTVTDMRAQLRGGNRSIIGTQLAAMMEQTLARKEQMMLFLNRRGYAGFVSCRSCGYVIKCPHCDVSLTYHSGGRLICHYCGYTTYFTGKCPSCGSDRIGLFRIGTQQVQEQVRKMFPQARTLRMDADTTRAKDAHGKILAAFARHEADILIGTQMIVKGHDFGNVTLVGILAADQSLNAPDYRCAERTFQLLTQAAGRAGRADHPGRVVIQTYDPDHYCIQCAATQNYEAFYRQEMGYRSLAGYPPAGRLTSIHLSGPDQAQMETASQHLRMFALRAAGRRGLTVLGPADEPVARIKDQYRKVLYLKADERAVIDYVRDKILEYIQMNEGFDGITVSSETE